jgi:L-ascorbate metabolism protein UlaG (beta-lactamase superfamily)
LVGTSPWTRRTRPYATREFLKPRFAIPIHYGTNPQLKGTPAEYRQALGETPTQVLSLNPGEIARF